MFEACEGHAPAQQLDVPVIFNLETEALGPEPIGFVEMGLVSHVPKPIIVGGPQVADQVANGLVSVDLYPYLVLA